MRGKVVPAIAGVMVFGLALLGGGQQALADHHVKWAEATDGSGGLDTARSLAGLEADFTGGNLEGLHGVVVARGGQLVLERYFRGVDQRRGTPLGEVDFTADTLHDLRSVSKSIVSLLYGIALSEGMVPHPVTPLMPLFEDHSGISTSADYDRLEVRHVLTMQMGLEWNEDLPYTDPRNSETAMDMAPDKMAYVLSRPVVEAPGTRWSYNGGATAILAHLIEKGSGQPLMQFARDRLLSPLGISDAEWVKDRKGVAIAASGMRLRPRDLARIGQLILQNGSWNGKQIVPADWIRASMTPRGVVGDGIEYGYQWWLGEMRDGSGRWMAGFGNGGQRLIVIPELDLVVVVTAGNYNQRDAWRLSVRLMAEHILPAVSR